MIQAGEIPTLTRSPAVGGSESPQRSFNFSKIQNLRELEVGASWIGGSLLWIRMALSTIKPATSPRLSTIKLTFARAPSPPRFSDPPIEGTGGDLQRVADEVARIEREFGTAVNLTVSRDRLFKEVLDTLNVRFLFRRADNLLIRSYPCLVDPSTLTAGLRPPEPYVAQEKSNKAMPGKQN